MAYDDQLEVVKQVMSFFLTVSIHEITGERNVNISIVIVIVNCF